MKRKRRKNPIAAAAELSEAWHGRPARKATTYVETLQEHGVLADLGGMEELEVRAGRRSVVPIQFDHNTRLASNESGTQLYLVGGDQSIDLEAFGLADSQADEVLVGEVVSITYYTAKHHLGKEDKKPGPYKHEFAEEGGSSPWLVYDQVNRLLRLVGGTYHIDRDMDGGKHSAGIRD